jgi:hypothetical protein
MQSRQNCVWTIWPIANAYDLRELFGLLSILTPLADWPMAAARITS